MRLALRRLILFAMTGGVAACDGDPPCTQAVAKEKAAQLLHLLQDTAAADPAKLPTWYPARLAEAAPLARDLAGKAAAGGEDLPATCAAIDALMAEFRK